MIALVLNVAVIAALVLVSAVRPGFGIGLALALGRHTFPDRDTPMFPAAPLFLVAAAFALFFSHRRVRIDWRHVLAVELVVLVVAVGAFRESAAIDTEVGLIADDKALYLVIVMIPLLLLSPALRYDELRVDVLRVLVAVPLALTLLSLAVGTTSDEGRATALGGGPITLATAAGIGILILLHFGDVLVPSQLSALDKPVRLAAGGVLALGMILSDSRQPILSLLIVLAAATITSNNKLLLSARDHRAVLRAKRIRLLSILVFVGSAIGLVQLVLAVPDSRLALLATNPTAELQRSRLSTWITGIEEISTAGVWGHGFGSFRRSEGAPLAYAHNLQIELLSEVGPLIGLIVLAALLVAGLAAMRTGDRLFGILAFYAWLGTNFSGDLYNSRYFFFFLLGSLSIGLHGSLTGRTADGSAVGDGAFQGGRTGQPIEVLT